MKKRINRVLICAALAAIVWTGGLIADKQTLRNELVRLHVVGATDSAEDQAMKLYLKDKIVESLKTDMASLRDAEAAKAYLQENLPKIEQLANKILQEAGCSDAATVSLCAEEFTTRVYDTFTLPAGVYDSLRITIGEGEGKNWWCVVFPGLCLPTSAEGFEEAASCAGFSDSLTGTLEGEYEVRSWILEVWGSVENFLHRD